MDHILTLTIGDASSVMETGGLGGVVRRPGLSIDLGAARMVQAPRYTLTEEDRQAVAQAVSAALADYLVTTREEPDFPIPVTLLTAAEYNALSQPEADRLYIVYDEGGEN